VSDKLMTVGDVAEMCQVHRKTVTRAIRSGRLRAARLGTRGAYRLWRDDVDHWLRDSAIDPVAAAPAKAARPGMLRLDDEGGRLT